MRKLQKINDGSSTSRGDVKSVKPQCVQIFKRPENDSVVESATKKKFAPMSRTKTRCSVNMYSQWRVNRMSLGLVPDKIVNANLDNVGELSKSDLCYALPWFIHEVKKID